MLQISSQRDPVVAEKCFIYFLIWERSCLEGLPRTNGRSPTVPGGMREKNFPRRQQGWDNPNVSYGFRGANSVAPSTGAELHTSPPNSRLTDNKLIDRQRMLLCLNGSHYFNTPTRSHKWTLPKLWMIWLWYPALRTARMACSHKKNVLQQRPIMTDF